MSSLCLKLAAYLNHGFCIFFNFCSRWWGYSLLGLRTWDPRLGTYQYKRYIPGNIAAETLLNISPIHTLQGVQYWRCRVQGLGLELLPLSEKINNSPKSFSIMTKQYHVLSAEYCIFVWYENNLWNFKNGLKVHFFVFHQNEVA